MGFILGVIIFGLVRFLLKKNNQTEYILKKKKPKPVGSNWPVSVRFKPTGFGSVQTDRFGSVQTDRFRFGLVLYDKNWFKPVCLGFGSVFLVWLGFGLIFLVWHGFFRLFFGLGSVRFFWLFFFGFLGLIGFLVFFLTPSLYEYYLKIKYFFWLWIIDSRLSYKL